VTQDEVPAAQVERLDQAVIRQLPKLSRSAAVSLISNGKVRVNGHTAGKASQKVRAEDQIAIDYDPAQQTVKLPKLQLPVIYEDKDCVVINKPTGVLTHSKDEFSQEPTVATWLESRAPAMKGERAGIVHRLDRATSGVMICAKTPDSLKWLQRQFSERKAKKTYVAIIKGKPTETEAVIDMPIERNPRKPQTFRVGVNGKPAVTAYKVLQGDNRNRYSLLELQPTTGRTHQLRVHLHKLGHPIVGDDLYDGPKSNRLYLHAEKLEITLLNKKRQSFEAPVSKSFKEVMA
jgi:23S rRNA pseudouridine1911/1915/1917 synthase